MGQMINGLYLFQEFLLYVLICILLAQSRGATFVCFLDRKI